MCSLLKQGVSGRLTQGSLPSAIERCLGLRPNQDLRKPTRLLPAASLRPSEKVSLIPTHPPLRKRRAHRTQTEDERTTRTCSGGVAPTESAMRETKVVPLRRGKRHATTISDQRCSAHCRGSE